MKISSKISEHYKNAEINAKLKIEKAETIELKESVIYSKEEVIKSSKDLVLIGIDISGQGIKKRCRKVDHIYNRIGFLAPQKLDDDLEILCRNAVDKYIEENYKEVKQATIIYKKVNYQAPTKESPLFYGMKEEMMSFIKKVAIV